MVRFQGYSTLDYMGRDKISSNPDTGHFPCMCMCMCMCNVGLPMCDTSGSHLGPILYFPTGAHFTPKWVPCLFLKVGLPTLVPFGEPKWDPLCFVQWAHMGHTWALPLGHSHVGPKWDPLLFPYSLYLGIPTWACPCWSQLGPIFIFIWDLHGHSHLGILMLVPIGTHLYFHMGFTWALLLWHAHAGPNWDPHLISPGTQLGIPTWAFP